MHIYIYSIWFYHPVCSRGFITQEWINMLFDNRTTLRYQVDFRAVASGQFQILRELCKLSKMVMTTDFQGFYDQELISGDLLSENLLRTEARVIIDAFYANSITNFIHTLSFVRILERGNELLSTIQTPYAFVIVFSTTGVRLAYTNNGFRVNTSYTCRCGLYASCPMLAAFYTDDTPFQFTFSYPPSSSKLLFLLQNWFISCWTLQSLLISPFDDNFMSNQTALEIISTYFNWSSNSIPIVLNESNLTNGNDVGTFNDLVQTLFIENFSTNLNYSLYFSQCQPQSCFYAIEQHPR
jgi:hypothetical protein